MRRSRQSEAALSRAERNIEAIAWFAAFVALADPILAEHGFADEDRRVASGYAHWHRDGATLAARLAVVEDEVWAQLDMVKGMSRLEVQPELLGRLLALGARRPYCPVCYSGDHVEPRASCIRD